MLPTFSGATINSKRAAHLKCQALAEVQYARYQQELRRLAKVEEDFVKTWPGGEPAAGLPPITPSTQSASPDALSASPSRVLRASQGGGADAEATAEETAAALERSVIDEVDNTVRTLSDEAAEILTSIALAAAAEQEELHLRRQASFKDGRTQAEIESGNELGQLLAEVAPNCGAMPWEEKGLLDDVEAGVVLPPIPGTSGSRADEEDMVEGGSVLDFGPFRRHTHDGRETPAHGSRVGAGPEADARATLNSQQRRHSAMPLRSRRPPDASWNMFPVGDEKHATAITRTDLERGMQTYDGACVSTRLGRPLAAAVHTNQKEAHLFGRLTQRLRQPGKSPRAAPIVKVRAPPPPSYYRLPPPTASRLALGLASQQSARGAPPNDNDASGPAARQESKEYRSQLSTEELLQRNMVSHANVDYLAKAIGRLTEMELRYIMDMENLDSFGPGPTSRFYGSVDGHQLQRKLSGLANAKEDMQDRALLTLSSAATFKAQKLWSQVANQLNACTKDDIKLLNGMFNPDLAQEKALRREHLMQVMKKQVRIMAAVKTRPQTKTPTERTKSDKPPVSWGARKKAIMAVGALMGMQASNPTMHVDDVDSGYGAHVAMERMSKTRAYAGLTDSELQQKTVEEAKGVASSLLHLAAAMKFQNSVMQRHSARKARKKLTTAQRIEKGTKLVDLKLPPLPGIQPEASDFSADADNNPRWDHLQKAQILRQRTDSRLACELMEEHVKDELYERHRGAIGL